MKMVPGTAALIKGISVLRAIADEEEAPIFSRLQSVTSLPKGTLHRILKALTLEGLVRYDSRNRTYHLGLHLLSLAYQVLEDMDVRDIARGELVRLRNLTGEAVHFAIRDNTNAVYIDVVESNHAVGPVAKIGSSSEFHNSAVGKAILANLPLEEQSKVIAECPMTRSTPNSITSRRRLKTHLDEVRRRGYAFNEEEETIGIHGVAAPVFDHRGEVVASVCITIPSYRFERRNLETYIAAVIDSAKAVSQRMGYSAG